MLRLGVAAGILCGLALAAQAEDPTGQPAPKPAAKAKKKAAPAPSREELARRLAEQQALIEEQKKLIADQEARISDQETKLAEQDASIDDQKKQLAQLQEALAAMNRRLEEIQGELPAADEQKALEARLKRIEESADKEPELPPSVVSAGDFPGSIRIPGTDAAIKFGGKIRFAAVLTLDPLGSDDRFLTNSIPVEPAAAVPGEGRRTTFTANTSRFNFEMRTPTGAGQLRTFIEGDFFGSNGNGTAINFRLRHAYAQFHGFIVGQTWSTFSDPAANHEDLDFEGMPGENIIRQAQVRYTAQVRDDLSVAGAAETPAVSLTGGVGVNVIPDLVGRAVWTFKKIGHLQGAIVLRRIRGEPDAPATGSEDVNGWGASISGVVPFYYFNLTDRFIFQVNTGVGNARYINDLNSLGGQDGAFDPATGALYALPSTGWYFDYEHQWKQWETTRKMKLRSSIIWSSVNVNNRDFQPGDAYHKVERISLNVVFSPIQRIDLGVEYLHGSRENKDGRRGTADQIQIVGNFRF